MERIRMWCSLREGDEMSVKKAVINANALAISTMFTDDGFYPIDIKLKPLDELKQTDGYTPMFKSIADKTLSCDFMNGFCFDPMLGWYVFKNGLYITIDMMDSITLTIRSDDDD